MLKQLFDAYARFELTDFLKECSLIELEKFTRELYLDDITTRTVRILETINQELEYRSSAEQQKKK